MKKFGSWTEQVNSAFRTSSDNKVVTVTPTATLPAASLTLTLPIPTAAVTTDTIVSLTSTDTLTNKTLTSPILTSPQINDTSADHRYIFAVSELTANRNVTLPLLTGDDTFVFNSHNATLINKNIDAGTNTLSNIADASISASAAIALSKLATVTGDRALISSAGGVISASSVTNTELAQLSGITSAAVGVDDAQTLTQKTLEDVIYGTTSVAITGNTVAIGSSTSIAITSGTGPFNQLSTAGDDGEYRIITNNTGGALTVAHDAGSGPVTRGFYTGTGQDVILSDQSSMTVIYSTVTNRWQVVGDVSTAPLTANRATETDANGFVVASAITSTKLGYLSDVTSAIQAQIDGKQAAVMTTRGDIVIRDATNTTARLAVGGAGTVLTSDGTDVAWSAPAGTGDVTAAANITDHALVRGNGGAKGIQDSGILIDDSDNITNITTTQADNGHLTKLANESSFTITAGYGMVNSNMTITTATTVTVAAGARLDVFDVITVVGTLDVIGDCSLR